MKNGKQPSDARLGRLARVPHEKKGMKLAAYRMRPDQIAALRREALKRAVARESGKPDASELVREAVDLWLAKHARHSKP